MQSDRNHTLFVSLAVDNQIPFRDMDAARLQRHNLFCHCCFLLILLMIYQNLENRVSTLLIQDHNDFESDAEGLCRTTLTDANQIQWYFCDCATAS